MSGLDDLRDRLELRELVDRYASGVDRRDFDLVAGLFTENGELLIHRPGDEEPARVYQGRAEIRRIMDGLHRFRATSHMVANQLLDVRGGRATGETYCVASHVYDEKDGDGQRIYVMSIRYEDTFARDADRWLFAARRERVDWAEDRVFTPARV
jgi:hypothetical protein